MVNVLIALENSFNISITSDILSHIRGRYVCINHLTVRRIMFKWYYHNYQYKAFKISHNIITKVLLMHINGTFNLITHMI